jgi:hypothetical protein
MSFDFGWFLLPVLGFAIGLLVSMLGGGGGIFYVPALTLLFDLPMQLAVSTSLASIIPTTAIASLSHKRSGNLDLSIGLIFGVAGITGALIGAYISSMLPSALLGKLFGLFMIAMGVPMTVRSKKTAGNTKEALPPLTWKRGALGSSFGILSGMMCGLFGVSGTPPVIAGLYILGFPATAVVGTSAFVLLCNSISGLTGHIVLEQFDLMLILLLAGGAAIGAYIGPKILAKIRAETLERIYGPLFVSTVVVLGIVMILR